MIKRDFLWLAALLAVVLFLVYPETHKLFISANSAHPYIMGFVKVAILATLGELLAIRITSGNYKKLPGLIYRTIIWGFIGMTFVLVFDIFSQGVLGVIKKGLLPSLSSELWLSRLLTAFFTSALLNLIFAPTFMTFHRFTDTYIDLGNGKLKGIFNVKLSEVINKIDWYGHISFVVLKTIPIFWIPAHTITFLLPSEYRVLMAAFLSIALGGILAFSKRRKSSQVLVNC